MNCICIPEGNSNGVGVFVNVDMHVVPVWETGTVHRSRKAQTGNLPSSDLILAIKLATNAKSYCIASTGVDDKS